MSIFERVDQLEQAQGTPIVMVLGLGFVGAVAIATAICTAYINSDLDAWKADMDSQVERIDGVLGQLMDALTKPVTRPKPVPNKRVVEPATDPIIPVQTGGPATVPTETIIDREHVELIVDHESYGRHAAVVGDE